MKRLQVDNEIQHVKIKDPNEQNNAEMPATAARGGEQKIRELKSRTKIKKA